jgi:hypothetical protein
VKLFEFLNTLFSTGEVAVARTMTDFLDEEDLKASARLIEDVYESDCFDLPAKAPAFKQDAALWAAAYLYHAIQFVLLRELEADLMEAYLKPYDGEQDAPAIYSVDLLFRHLGPLFKFSSGISPDDPLVARLKDTAGLWPFSSVGLGVKVNTNTAVILSHPALRYVYLDRIILHRDLSRLTDEQERAVFREVTGIHSEQFWPGAELAELTNIKMI